MPDLAVAYRRRLVHTRARLQPSQAMTLVLKFNPPLEHIDELKVGTVQVRLADIGLSGHRAYDMRHHLPAGGLLNAQVAATW